MVEDSGGGRDSFVVPDIAQLLTAYRDRTGDSYDEMARRIDYAIKPARLHQLVREAPKNFPEPRTVEALARLLQMPVATIVLALAASLGIEVRDSAPVLAQHLPPGTDVLTDEDRDAILAVTRSLVDARRGAAGVGDAGTLIDLARPPLPDLSRVAARKGTSEGKRRRRRQDDDAER